MLLAIPLHAVKGEEQIYSTWRVGGGGEEERFSSTREGGSGSLAHLGVVGGGGFKAVRE